MKLSDLNSSNDDLEIYFTDDDDKKKKKKKGKKGKKKKGKGDKYAYPTGGRDAYKESLKELKKDALHDKLIELGIDTRKIDLESKKEMRRAILKKVYGDKDTAPKKDLSFSNGVAKNAPHYYDETTGDYVIPRALDTDDINCFDAMCNLGKLRTRKRADDGFGELMTRLTSKIRETAALEERATPRDIIDVADFTVHDAPKQQSRQDREVSAILGSMSDTELKALDSKLDTAISKSQRKHSK